MEPLQGKIDYIGQTQAVSEKFKKREFAIEVPDGQYSQFVKFEFTQDKCSLLDNFQVGQDVSVSFNFRGNKYTSKKDGNTSYFTSLQAWRIESSTQGQQSATGATAAPQNDNRFAVSDDDNSLPF